MNCLSCPQTGTQNIEQKYKRYSPQEFHDKKQRAFLSIWEHDLLISCSNNSLQARPLRAATYICTLFQLYLKQMCPPTRHRSFHWSALHLAFCWFGDWADVSRAQRSSECEEKKLKLRAKEICANIHFEHRQLNECKGSNLNEKSYKIGRWNQRSDPMEVLFTVLSGFFLQVPFSLVFIVSVHHSCTGEDATCNPGSFRLMDVSLFTLFSTITVSHSWSSGHTARLSPRMTVLPVL